jgi:sodium/myo-inositol cotransporter 3
MSILLQIGIVAVLTVTGGLTAVIYTDTLQAVLMIGGALALMAKGFVDVGGFDELWRRYPLAVTNYTVPNTTCHEVNPNWNVMLRGPSDPEMPWPGFLLGQTPGSIWYWCSDQVIVQRALAAKSLSHAQGATILAAFAKILPLFMMVMPGMIARVLYTDEVACVDPEICYQTCQSHTGCTNIAYPKLVLGIMPTGARGVMMAVMLAALMSDLDSIFNSASTMFTIDIYQRIRPKAGTKELMIVGRLFVMVMVGVAIAWVPVVKETQGGQLFIYIQEVSLYLSPPIACIYLLAVLWPRCNEKGAFWGLMVGFVTGVTRLILVFVYPGPDRCGEEDTRPRFLRDFHYMYFAILLFWLTFAFAVVISLLTDPPTYQQLYRTTYWTRFENVNRDELEKGTIITAWDRMMCCFKTMTPKESQTYDNPIPVTDYDGDVNHFTASTADSAAAVNEHGCDSTAMVQSNGDAVELDTIKNEVVVVGLFVKPDTAEESAPKKMTWKQFCFSWLCGIAPEGVKPNDEEERKAKELEEKICSLSQDPKAKIMLHILLVIILSFGVTLYTFWSLWRYEVPPEKM